jgi:hypothetical protein
VEAEPISLRALVVERDWETLWLGAQREASRASVLGRALIWLVVLVLTVRFAAHGPSTNFAGDSFLHVVNLVFHEAGHILFSFAGPLVTSLGGSLTQVLVPLVCAVALRRHDDVIGASLGVWWVGQNLVDLAPYINDARALQLVLLGGHTGAEVEGHDWEFILQSLGLLHWDHGLARFAHGAGSLLMVAALVWAAIVLVRQRRRDDAAFEAQETDPRYGRGRTAPFRRASSG